jgi:hypothetical protein
MYTAAQPPTVTSPELQHAFVQPQARIKRPYIREDRFDGDVFAGLFNGFDETVLLGLFESQELCFLSQAEEVMGVRVPALALRGARGHT